MGVKATGWKGLITVFPLYIFQIAVYMLILQIQRMHYYQNKLPGKNLRQVLTITPTPEREGSLSLHLGTVFEKSIPTTEMDEEYM